MQGTLHYNSGNREITLGMDQEGTGRSAVLLPALSSVSTRHEMRPLFDRLRANAKVATVDWPGFGDHARPRAAWTPEMLSDFLHWFLTEILCPPHTIVAAGHAATYALYETVHHPGVIERLVMVAPTWRGPLPTVMNGVRPWFARIRWLTDAPILGQMLYRLNVSRVVVSKMAREHVYSAPDWLTGDRMRAKLTLTRVRGGPAWLGPVCDRRS